jgi:hypothetical protein
VKGISSLLFGQHDCATIVRFDLDQGECHASKAANLGSQKSLGRSRPQPSLLGLAKIAPASVALDPRVPLILQKRWKQSDTSQHLRQLRHIGRDAPRLVAREQLRRRAPASGWRSLAPRESDRGTALPTSTRPRSIGGAFFVRTLTEGSAPSTDAENPKTVVARLGLLSCCHA